MILKCRLVIITATKSPPILQGLSHGLRYYLGTNRGQYFTVSFPWQPTCGFHHSKQSCSVKEFFLSVLM